MSGHPSASPLALPDVIDPNRWQRLQEHFAGVLGITLRTVSPAHQLLVTPSWPSGLDHERTINLLRIGQELPPLLPLGSLPTETATLTTPLGVTYAAVPLRATAEQILAYSVVGPVVVGLREDAETFRRRMQNQHVEADPIWKLLLSVKLYTFTGFRSVLSLLEDVENALLQLAYQSRQLAALVPHEPKVDSAITRYYTDKVLHALLDTATTATKAEGGSILTYDPTMEAFRICASEGLSEEILQQTVVKRGEGIVGLVAQEQTIMLLDEEVTDSRLRTLMKRPQLRSSLVAALRPESSTEPIGVLNLRTSNPDRRFTGEHVVLLRKLLELAGLALGSLRLVVQDRRPLSPT